MTINPAHYPVWFPVGDQALMLDFTGFTPVLSPQEAGDAELSYGPKIRQLAQQIASHNITGIIEIVPALTRLMLRFDASQTSAQKIKQAVSLYLETNDEDSQATPRHWCLPICYDGPCGPDCDAVAEATGLTKEEVISRHLASQLDVSVMGFLPGLGYMTGVDSTLTLPRRANPRTSVPANSVGIAIGQCVIYPVTSPGGWHLIGRIAYPLFDPKRTEPILLRSGDKVSFRRISQDELASQETAYEAGDFSATDLVDKLANDLAITKGGAP